MVTSAQLRAARSLLDWTVRDLAERAGVHRNTVSRAETDETEHGHAVAQIVRTFETAGVAFLEPGEMVAGGSGVRLKASSEGTGGGPNPIGPATDVVEAMDAAITQDRKTRQKP